MRPRPTPRFSRRALLGGAAGTAAASALSGCGGFSKSSSSSSGGSAGKESLRFMTWASDAEKTAFQRLAKAFGDQEGVTVDLKIVPYEEMFTTVDNQLAAGDAPDIFRVDYPTMGVYSGNGQLLDLSQQLDADLTGDFIPALYTAVQYDGKPFGVPHQTDTTAVVYQPAMFKAAGITSVPDKLEDAWTWEEFAQVSAKLEQSLAGKALPFVYDWQQFGAYRWLNWLFQADGRVLEDDLKTPAVMSDAGRKALDFTTRFFTEGWVPRNTSTKGVTYPDTVFQSGKTAMAFVGDFLLPGLDDNIDGFTWKATYMPRDVRAASDLGGNALVATADTANADLAASFLRFMVEPANMQSFCEDTTELPTRTSLVSAKLDYGVRPDLMPVFVEQATTLTPDDVAQVTVPFASQINTVLRNELDLCFTGKQSADDTLQKISDGLEKAAG